MALPDTQQDHDGDDSFRWGTWEELLLAFAVNRHGTGAWPSIASELQKRSSDPNLTLTAQNCRQKYLDLKRRYVAENDDESVTGDKSNDGEDSAASATTLLEELRKLRVAELRREVQRYDLHIESLELKMKSMEDEREKGSRRDRAGPDPERKSEENGSEQDVKPDEEPSPEPIAGGEQIAADELEKDHMSVNESNSTDLGAEKTRTGEKELEPVEAEAAEAECNRESSEEPADMKSEPDLKPDREDSCNGSSNSIEKESGKAAIAERASESGESEAESKGGDEAMKESSDVQSSASRSKKEGGIDKARRGNTSGDERDHEDQSRSIKDLSAQSQPLIDFLQVIRSHKLGSVFERRLRSQETSKYQKLILQHVDFETIEQRLKEGWYLGSSSKFFRDLLLLVNNALVFFSKNSSEAQAAIEFRKLIAKEMSQKFTKSDSSSRKQISLQSLSLTKKEDREASHSLLLKPRISGSLIVCRKRSSIAAKAAGSSSGADSKKKEQTASLAEEKDTKLQSSQPSENAEEPKITKKRTRDRFPLVAANSKKNGKNQSNNSGNKNPVAESGKNQGKGGSSSLHSEPKGATKKKNQPIVDSKKRGAANFLNRIKQSSSSNNGALLDALKNTPLTSESTSSKGGSEQKKNDSGRRGDKKDHQVATKQSSETRQVKEKGSPAKRNVGRPPKTGTASRPNLGKRGRERDETPVSKQPKKRSKKL